METSPSTLFPKIGGRAVDVIKALRKNAPGQSGSPITLVGKVKLHGAHADIVFHGPDGNYNITFQSRNRTNVTPKEDIYGFATTMTRYITQLGQLRSRIVARYHDRNRPEASIKYPIILSGEWIGKGVQKGVGISQLDPRFVILGVQINGQWQNDADYIDIHDEEANVYSLCHQSAHGECPQYSVDFDLSVTESVEQALKKMQELADAVEEQCPFAKSFGISGRGEGIVWKATILEGYQDPETWLKTKGPLSRSQGVKSPKDQEALNASKASMDGVVGEWVTERRLEQGVEYLQEHGKAVDLKEMALFLKWIADDVVTEEKTVIAEKGFAEKDVRKSVIRIAGQWFKVLSSKYNAN